MKTYTVILLIPILLLCSIGYADSTETKLFNGKDLKGWSQVGGGKWSVKNGEIIGESGDGSYGWLVTDRDYADFILELKFKAEDKGNSGIQFRSHLIDGKMHGYQAECDPIVGNHTGGIYEELGRGWLAQPTPEGEKALQPNEWNHYRIQMIGDHITTYLNGKKIVDFEDSKTKKGIIALQVHSKKNPPVKMRFKDISITDLGYGPGWRQLFNGKNLDGWKNHGKEKWYVEDGAIVGQAVTEEYGYLATKEKYTDFEVRLKFKAEGTGNSGLFYHSYLDGVKIYGVQAEIDPTPGNHSGGLYESYGKGWLVQPDETGEKVMRGIGKWNELRLWVKGNHIITHVNGFQTVDFIHEKPRDIEGVIALQLHSGGKAAMRFRDIFIRDVE
jgi:hypothetical protein